MKPRRNRIIAARFRAQHLMQTLIAIGPRTPRGRSLLHRLGIALKTGNVSLASMGMTCSRQDRFDHRKTVRAAGAKQARLSG